jgi:hypothetical protein
MGPVMTCTKPSQVTGDLRSMRVTINRYIGTSVMLESPLCEFRVIYEHKASAGVFCGREDDTHRGYPVGKSPFCRLSFVKSSLSKLWYIKFPVGHFCSGLGEERGGGPKVTVLKEIGILLTNAPWLGSKHERRPS